MQPNEDPEDYLTVDEEIYGQNFCCLSFIEQKNMELLAKKESYIATNFLKNYLDDYKVALEHNKEMKPVKYDDIKKIYEDYRIVNFGKLSNSFEKLPSNDEVTIRGVKVRGTFRTLKQARTHADKLQKIDPIHHIFVGQVGYWLAFDPINVDDIDAKYQNEKLNEIVGEKVKQKETDMSMFENRRHELKGDSIGLPRLTSETSPDNDEKEADEEKKET